MAVVPYMLQVTCIVVFIHHKIIINLPLVAIYLWECEWTSSPSFTDCLVWQVYNLL